MVWYPQHSELLEQKMLHGIEVVNGRDYYPEAHRWAVEKKLTMLSNSDVHSPLHFDYHVHEADHRPITLVFAKERSAEAIKQALFNRDTVVYSGNRLVGEQRFLEPIFQQSIRLSKSAVTIKGKQRVSVQISNASDLDYVLETGGDLEHVAVPKKLTLPARKTVLFSLQGKASDTEGLKTLSMPYKVTNLLVAPGEPLTVTLTLEATFQPAG